MNIAMNVAAGDECAPVPSAGWKFDVGDCITHTGERPMPSVVVSRSMTRTGPEVYIVESMEPRNFGRRNMMLAEALVSVHSKVADCFACALRGTEECPLSIDAENAA